jgi:hypothetical protein
MARFTAYALAALAGVTALAVGILVAPAPDSAQAASHREAPLIALDPSADITDFFMFRSYEPGNADKVVLIMNVNPGEEPSAGPNYYNFDPSVLYAFGIDNNQDGRADETISLRFRNEIRGAVDALDLPLSYLGNVPPPERGAGAGSIVPPITALDGPGSEGLGLRQRYSVTIEQNNPGEGAFQPRGKPIRDDLIAVPSNVGPRTMPNYDALAQQGVYDLGNGIRVFAGQRNDPFYIDLGAVFDTLNLRRFPPLLSAAEDVSDANTFGFNMLAGFSVNTIAIELPASMLTADGKGPGQTASPQLGAYAWTARPSLTVRGLGQDATKSQGRFVQIQRLANPLVNELIIGTGDKDAWNTQIPDFEEQFLPYYLKPRISAAMEAVFGFPTGCALPVPQCSPSPPASVMLPGLDNFNRTDLVTALLKYSPADTNLSELLRLDLTAAPTPLASQNRLGSVLGGDPAGWPNGRRPKDDVTDIVVRVAGGPNYITNRAGDGVNSDDAPLTTTFPFLATPSDGRDLNPAPHVDPTP